MKRKPGRPRRITTILERQEQMRIDRDLSAQCVALAALLWPDLPHRLGKSPAVNAVLRHLIDQQGLRVEVAGE